MEKESIKRKIQGPHRERKFKEENPWSISRKKRVKRKSRGHVEKESIKRKSRVHMEKESIKRKIQGSSYFAQQIPR
jgi:hypothetical protein